MPRSQLGVWGIVAVVCTLLAGGVLATPSSGVTSQIAARAVFLDPVDVKFNVHTAEGREVIQVREAQETVMQEIVITPGGHTGWHSHPGPVVVLVKSGTLTFYSGDDSTCTGRPYSAGQAFIDSGQGHVHIARNEGTENLVLWATYFDVPVGGATRVDATNPGNCAF
jgi:quercetin dioxygenase-like cupin family protein